MEETCFIKPGTLEFVFFSEDEVAEGIRKGVREGGSLVMETTQKPKKKKKFPNLDLSDVVSYFINLYFSFFFARSRPLFKSK